MTVKKALIYECLLLLSEKNREGGREVHQHHSDPVEQKVCPLCREGLSSDTPEDVRLHTIQGIVWKVIKECPAELLEAELEYRKIKEEGGD